MSLGIILSPYGQIPGSFPHEVGYSYGGNGTFMCPEDPYQNQRGEPGFYSDTQLGGAGLGAETPEYAVLIASFASAIQHAIVGQGQSRGGLLTRRGGTTVGPRGAMRGLGSSIPGDLELQPTYGFAPHMSGWIATKQGFVQTSWVPPNGYRSAPLSGPFGDIPPANVDPEVAKILQAMNEQNAKMFTLSIVTTLAIAVSAIIQVIRNTKALKQEHALLKREIAAQ